MSRNLERAAGRGRSKGRRTSLLWVLAAVAVVVVLLAQEQIAALYVLATLGVAALLTVVALSDLKGARQRTEQAAPYDDAATIGDGRTTPAATTATAFRPSTPRAVRGRRR